MKIVIKEKYKIPPLPAYILTVKRPSTSGWVATASKNPCESALPLEVDGIAQGTTTINNPKAQNSNLWDLLNLRKCRDIASTSRSVTQSMAAAAKAHNNAIAIPPAAAQGNLLSAANEASPGSAFSSTDCERSRVSQAS